MVKLCYVENIQPITPEHCVQVWIRHYTSGGHASLGMMQQSYNLTASVIVH